ncbi:MAG TPA: DUF1223 domain-containing protein [Burkholderiaceae bacterium]
MSLASRLATAWLLAPLAVSAGAPACQVSAGAEPPRVIELYTSEGCDSCPPADRWLSTLKGRRDVLALSFHVTYWDRLGWVDRFASPEGTARQELMAHAAGRRSVYTPEVMVDGRDWMGWRNAGVLPAAAMQAAPSLMLSRAGEAVIAKIGALKAGQLEAYWAVLEDDWESQVRSGENQGKTLRHDHVVRFYQPVPAWAASAGTELRLPSLPMTANAAHPRRIVLVISDAATHRPLQAASLGC